MRISERGKRAVTTSVCLLILAWLALSASGHGIVIWQSSKFIAQGHSGPAIRCTFFTGTGIFHRGYLYARDDRLGYSSCPMWAPY